MTVGLILPTGCIMFSLLLNIVYFSKKRLNNIENKIYKYILITNFISLIFEFICTYFTFNMVNLISPIIIKIYLLILLLYMSLLSIYISVITKSTEKLEKSKNKIKLSYLIFYLIFAFFIIIGEVDFNITSLGASATGSSVSVLYIQSTICPLLWLLNIFINRSHNNIQKLMPFISYLVIALPISLVQLYNPGMLLVTPMETFVTMLMYFTIENPDVKMLKEMELAKTDAEKANRAKSDFLSSMSHEIRTPLNAIVGFSECIKTSNSLEEAKDNANDIITASNTLLEIVNSKYESKKLLNDVATLIKPKMDEKALDFQISISEDIPEVLYGDHTNLKKIITNLLSNAAKYTDSGFVKYDVKCINNNKTTRLIISVEDSGRGIKKENIDKLFTKFQRLDEDRNTTIEGTGLGLAITKQLVELMGGKIVVHSDYKKGSKFTVIIDQKIENESIKKDEKKKQTKLDLKGKKILIVDDNTLNLKVAAKFLEIYKPEVETVESGFACLEKVKDNNYDLILLDDMMPKMSGVETLKKLKENEDFKTPVVVLTANAISGMKEKYLKEGFDDYLAKPINKEELKNILEKVLNKEEETSVFGELPKEVYEIGNKKQIPIAQPANTTSQIEEEKAENNNDTTDNDNTSILIENGVDLESALELLGGIDTYNETLEEFVNASEKRKQRIEKYLEKENMNDYSIEVHALKSDCKYLGFMKLADIAFNHELKSKASNQEFIKKNYQELITEWNKILNISKEYLDKIK